MYLLRCVKVLGKILHLHLFKKKIKVSYHIYFFLYQQIFDSSNKQTNEDFFFILAENEENSFECTFNDDLPKFSSSKCISFDNEESICCKTTDAVEDNYRNGYKRYCEDLRKNILSASKRRDGSITSPSSSNDDISSDSLEWSCHSEENSDEFLNLTGSSIKDFTQEVLSAFEEKVGSISSETNSNIDRLSNVSELSNNPMENFEESINTGTISSIDSILNRLTFKSCHTFNDDAKGLANSTSESDSTKISECNPNFVNHQQQSGCKKHDVSSSDESQTTSSENLVTIKSSRRKGPNVRKTIQEFEHIISKSSTFLENCAKKAKRKVKFNLEAEIFYRTDEENTDDEEEEEEEDDDVCRTYENDADAEDNEDLSSTSNDELENQPSSPSSLQRPVKVAFFEEILDKDEFEMSSPFKPQSKREFYEELMQVLKTKDFNHNSMLQNFFSANKVLENIDNSIDSGYEGGSSLNLGRTVTFKALRIDQRKVK